MDADLLRFYFVTSSGWNYTNSSLVLSLTFLDSAKNLAFKHTVDSKNIYLASHKKFSEYHAIYVDARLAITNTKIDYEKFETLLSVEDAVTRAVTKKYIQVKIKYLETPDNMKNSSMICTKCLHLTKKNDYVSLKWWIELNKRIGYQKIFICDHMIEKDASFRKLFDQNRHILEVGTLKCIPNLQRYSEDRNELYLPEYKSLTNGPDRVYDVDKLDRFNEIVLNECYMNNIDKYRYITIGDYDEAVLPKKLTNFKKLEYGVSFITKLTEIKKSDPTSDKSVFKNLKCAQNYNLDAFLVELTFANNLKRKFKQDVSFHFKQGTYIPNRLANKIFDELEKRLSKTGPVDLNIEVLKLKSNTTLTLTIRNKREFNYAVNLLKVYKTTLKGFFEKSARFLSNSNYDRFFFIAGDVNHNVEGKTVHNTRRSMDFYLHTSKNVIDLTQPMVQYFKEDGDDFIMPVQYGHMAHFRKFVDAASIDLSSVPFESFHLDMNYLLCYFIPMMSQVKI